MSAFENVVIRAADVAGTYGRKRVTPSRVDALALATLSAQAARQQLELFAKWCYVQHDGQFVHIMPTGQIPSGGWTPWGSSGKSKMTKIDRAILRRWLLAQRAERHFPPWLYHEDERRWYVDLMRYDNVTPALSWLNTYSLDGRAWLGMRLSVLR